MLSSEKRSLVRFLAIYLSSTFTLFTLGTFIFYNFQKHQIIDQQNTKLSLEAEQLIQKLRTLHNTFDSPLIYPTSPEFNSAIYNVNKEYIFGTFKVKNIAWDKAFQQQAEVLISVHEIYPYYLGASYLVLSQKLNLAPLNELLKISLLFLLIAGIVFTLLGMVLGKLFTAPMKESIETMNKFIEDTTHELNTPISTILTNIELLDTIYDCDGKKEMKRIEMASKTLSRLYEDLTFLKLNHNYHREVISLNISELTEQRVHFFQTLIEAKELELIKTIDKEVFLEIDQNDAIRLVDNLLSNAIKYNKKMGKLEVTLNVHGLSVKNEGLGIEANKIGMIHKRFSRANKSEGGFGIGLDIISQVVERYAFKFEIQSTYKKHTEASVTW